MLPACTVVETTPVAGSDTALVGNTARPPIDVVSVKFTVLPPIGLPATSTNLNDTKDDSWRPAPPVPRNAIEVGLADTNWIEPMAGAVTVNVPVDDAERPVTEAVMVSTLAQPLSR